MTRRERFRAYMASVDPATNPLSSIERGFYVNPPGAIAKQIVGRFEIEPAARQLIVGGIGSGKTTQLLVAARSLNEIPDISAKYVDVSNCQDLGRMRPGCLVALASSELLTLNSNADKSLVKRVENWTKGYWADDEGQDWGDDGRWVPGIISEPGTAWPNIYQRHVDDLRTIAEVTVANGRHPIILFDSMDRMSDNAAFSGIVDEDVAAFHACGVGIVLVGPLRSLEGFGRIDAERFDHLHIQAPINVGADVAGLEFLASVLERRATGNILASEARAELVLWSGGVLRDLMSLAKLAGEEAYLDGAEAISVVHVRRAADRFGRSLLIGLQSYELDKLRQVHESRRFVQVSPSDTALVATRRILAYGDETGTYAVHPTIDPLIVDIGVAS